MLRDINFKVFKKLLYKSKLTSITIDIDSSVVNVEGYQEGAAKGYNPKNISNLCYNIQFAFCDEIMAYITGFVRSGNTYTANGAAELIKEIVANTELPSEKVVISYEKRGNAENYIKETKYDMAVGYPLLKSFWANEAVFQMMMLSYNLFCCLNLIFWAFQNQAAN